MDAGLRVGFGRASLGKSNLLSWDVEGRDEVLRGGGQVGSTRVHRK